VPIEFLGTELLLAMARQDRLQRGISSFNCLKGSQRRLNPVLREMVKNGMGLIASRHDADSSRAVGSP